MVESDITFRRRAARPGRDVLFFGSVVVWLLTAGSLWAGNFYAGLTPATVPWTNGIVPYEFTNALTAAMKQTYLDGLREWELAANVKFVPHTNQVRWILFTYNTNGFNNVSVGYNPQVVSIASLSRAQVGHEMGHSFGFNHENIRMDQASYLSVISGNVTPGNLQFFQIDPTTVTNGGYDFESVMHLGWDFASTQPGVLPTQQPQPSYAPRYRFRMGNLCLSPGDRAALKYLYGPPAVPLTNVVTTTADSGPGSLRAALYYITDSPGTSARFNIPVSDPGYSNGVFNIHLTGHLPPLAKNALVIDGSTQPGFTGQPLIVVDGSKIIPETFTSNSGLLIYSASNQVKNISFSGFNWNGLTLRFADATNNLIAGCWLGLDAAGSAAAPNANQGIYLDSGPSGNIIGGANALARNVISGNAQYGLWMSDSNTTGNRVLGNYIGTDASGSFAVANALGGIGMFYSSAGQVIGGTNAAARNVISGNGSAGIWLSGPGVSNNLVQGNFIGLNAAGTVAVANTFAGIYVVNGARSNAILNNVISGNFWEGLRLADAGTAANLVQGNFIGTAASGMSAVPNGAYGLTIFSGASGNTIGGPTSAARNVISGNNVAANYSEGLRIQGAGATANVVQGNFIGTDATGTNPLANAWAGLTIFSGAASNLIGGTSGGARNIISGNGGYGLVIGNPGTSGNLVQGNYIGTDSNGTNGLGNPYGNLAIWDGATRNAVGDVNAGAGNTIAFSSGTGVILYDSGTINNSIRGNSIFSNDYLAIDFNNDGVTPNDTGDADAGPNNLQNFPVITNAFGYATSTIILGKLNSATNRSFFIDVYRSVSPDYAGYGEGQFYLGSVSVTTDSSGNAGFTLTNNTGNYAGQYFTATATSTAGDTSEFNLAILATNKPAPSALFTGPYLIHTNGFAFMLTFATNFSYRIQAATNLLQTPVPWIDLTNWIATNSSLTFTDRTATNYRVRFYRVVSP